MFKFFKKKTKWFDDYDNYNRTHVDNIHNYNMILTDNVNFDMNPAQTKMNNNVLLIAGERTGKTRSVILPNLLQMNRNYVIIDSYATLYNQTANMFKEHGYNVKTFNCFDVKNSMHYNPFEYVRGIDDIELIVDYLFLKSNDNKDAFYDNLKKTLVLSCCFYLYETKSNATPIFSDLFDLITMIPDGTLDVKMSELNRQNPQSKAVQRYNVFKAGRIANVQKIVDSILTDSKFQFLSSKNMRILLNDDSLDLFELNQEKQVLFINTTGSNEYSDFIIPLLCAQTINAIAQHKTDVATHVQFILNEHVDSCLPAYMELVKEVYVNLWEEKISFIMTISDVGQLESPAYDMWNVVQYCMKTTLFLGSNDWNTLEWMSERLNGLMTVNELQQLPIEKCILLIDTMNPFLCDKYNVEQHPNFRFITPLI